LSRGGTKKGQAELERKRRRATQRPQQQAPEVEEFDPVLIPGLGVFPSEAEAGRALEALPEEQLRKLQMGSDAMDFMRTDAWIEEDVDDGLSIENETFWANERALYRHLLSLGYTPEEIGGTDEEVELARALQDEGEDSSG
jgi:hypothetical protein